MREYGATFEKVSFLLLDIIGFKIIVMRVKISQSWWELRGYKLSWWLKWPGSLSRRMATMPMDTKKIKSDQYLVYLTYPTQYFFIAWRTQTILPNWLDCGLRNLTRSDPPSIQSVNIPTKRKARYEQTSVLQNVESISLSCFELLITMTPKV